MPFVDLPERGLRLFVRINRSSNSAEDDARSPTTFLDPSKPTIILLHAALTNGSWIFGEQFDDERLSAGFNLVAPDLRFCGRTTSDARPDFALEENKEDIKALISALSLTQFSLIGHGALGCNTAVWLTIDSPHSVQSLVLCSPAAIEVDQQFNAKLASDWLGLACRNKEGRGDGTGTMPRESFELCTRYFFGNVAGRNAARRDYCLNQVQERYGTGQPPAELANIMNYWTRKPIPASLRAQVACPVLILHGSEDLSTSTLEMARQWQAGFPSARGGAELHTLVGAPHLLAYFDASVANRFFVRFISKALAEQPSEGST